MASRRELLNSISCDMRPDKSFFMKIYGYELTWAGFAEDALTRLEFLGCEALREMEWEEERRRIMEENARIKEMLGYA